MVITWRSMQTRAARHVASGSSYARAWLFVLGSGGQIIIPADPGWSGLSGMQTISPRMRRF